MELRIPGPSSIRVGSADYRRHLEHEIEHYSAVYEDQAARKFLVQPVPESWVEAERRAAEIVRQTTGGTLYDHIYGRLRSNQRARLLSLGSGPGGLELEFARAVPSAEIVCLDVNPTLLNLGRDRAAEEGLSVSFELADLNTVVLPNASYDLVFAHASLHHVIELEHVAEQIRRTLRPGGEFITVDVITPNGFRLWPENREVATKLFQSLPPKYRVNHTAYDTKRVDEMLW